MNKNALSLPILISLVVGNMIGTGIYVLPASLAPYGGLSLIAWLYTAIGALFLALTFSSLNKRFPKTGGPYIYCKQAYGKLVGFITAYTYWISNLVSIAGIVVAGVGYLGFVTPILNSNHAAYQPWTALAIELAVIWLFTIINIIGIHTAGIVQLILTVIKLTPLLIVTLVGIGSIHIENLIHLPTGQASHFSAISSAAALTFWAFIGLESATIPAENTKGPRDIFKATVFGTLAVSLIYIVSSIVIMGMLPMSQLATSQFPFAEAGTLLFGAHAATIIALCAFLSGIGALNVCILIQGQIVFAAARDHLFPRMFTKLSKNDVPIAGQLLSSCIVSIYLLLSIKSTLLEQFNNIALLASLLTLATYFMVTLSEIKFSLQSKMVKPLIIALLAGLYSVWMMASFNHSIMLLGLVTILICVPIYYFTVRKYAA